MSSHPDVEWADVPGFDGYQATRDGRVRGPQGREMRPMKAEHGYLYVLCNRGRHVPQRKLFVHRAVLLAFVGECPPGLQCRHIDGDPTNNTLRNLCWGTPEQNALDKIAHGRQRRGDTVLTAKLTEADVVEIRRLIATPGNSLRSLAKRFGVSHTAIRRAANGSKWAHVTEASNG